MKSRKRCLPPGWYPFSPGETEAEIRRMEEGLPSTPAAFAPAVVAPHAGWAMSGRLALKALRQLDEEVETVVVVGGHLASGDGILAASEAGYDTPLGVIPADNHLLDILEELLPVQVDTHPDNTVEIQLPLLRYLFPEASALWLRASPDRSARELGKALAGAAARANRRIAVVGSTDLTHYGPAYGFTPAGRGEQALSWSRRNDRALIDCLLGMDWEGALDHARRTGSACSVGGAVAALTYAGSLGVKKGELLEYATSHQVHPSENFVGYAAIAYRRS